MSDQQNKFEKLTPEKLREYEGFEDINEEKAKELVYNIDRFAELLCKMVIKKLNNEKPNHTSRNL